MRLIELLAESLITQCDGLSSVYSARHVSHMLTIIGALLRG